MSSAKRRNDALPRTSPRVIAKGRRAKRGRRREYKDVFLNCGILNKREVLAIESLRSMRGDAEIKTKTKATAMPQEKEGLRRCVERLVDYVGCLENEVPVEFWIPQVAHALQLDATTLEFVVDVLLCCQVLRRKECGSFLWRGTDEVCRQLRCSVKQCKDDTQPSDGRTCDLSEFCSMLLITLKDFSKEPFSLDCLTQEIMRTLRGDCLKIRRQLEIVCCVLLGAGILHETIREAELCYTLQPPSNSSLDLEKPTLGMTHLPADQNQLSGPPTKQQWSAGMPLSLSLVLDNMAARSMLESLMQRVGRKDKTDNSIQAAIMEIAQTGVCQVGVVDVLGHGALVSPNNERTNSVIALAIPQGMLTNKQSQLPAHQIHAYEIVGLENGLPSNKQPVFMSYLPMTHGSLTELLGQAVHGHKALVVDAEALQSSSVSKLKQF